MKASFTMSFPWFLATSCSISQEVAFSSWLSQWDLSKHTKSWTWSNSTSRSESSSKSDWIKSAKIQRKPSMTKKTTPTSWSKSLSSTDYVQSNWRFQSWSSHISRAFYFSFGVILHSTSMSIWTQVTWFIHLVSTTRTQARQHLPWCIGHLQLCQQWVLETIIPLVFLKDF